MLSGDSKLQAIGGASLPNAGRQGDSSANTILKANGLHYQMPKNLSVIELRTQNVYRADGNASASGGQILRCTLQTGSAYVDPKESYVTFKWALTGGANDAEVTHSNIGALACFNGVRLISRSGVEIYRVTDLDLFLSRWLPATKPREWWSSRAASFNGAYSDTKGDPSSTKYLSNGTMYSAAFPLELLMGPFAQHKLIPSHLISGATIELQVNPSAKTAFKYTKDPTTAHIVISDFEVHASICTLSESSERSLDRVASVNGLEVFFSGISTGTTGSTNDYNEIPITKACSRASFLFTVFRLTSDIAAHDKDSYASPAGNFFGLAQLRHGSIYMPTQAAKLGTLDQIHMFNGLQFGQVTAAKVINDEAYLCVAQSLERSPILKYSGTSSNNSRQISHLVRANLGSKQHTINTFLIYDVLCRASLENVIISE